MTENRVQVIVIGGGITGLCCAHRLHGLGVDTLLLEASDRVGGRIRTITENGFEFEAGPNTLMDNSPALNELIDELGMRHEVVRAAAAAKKRYVYSDGELRDVPMGLVSAITSPLLGIPGIFGVLGDLFRGKPAGLPADESVSSFIGRRFGSRVLENLVTPFLSGVYAGDPEKLEAKSILKPLVEAEAKTGSVIRGMLRARREARRAAAQPPHSGSTPSTPSGKRPRAQSMTFRGGLGAVGQRIVSVLGSRVRTGAKVVSMIPEDHGYRVGLQSGESVLCDRVVIATETALAAKLIEGLPGATGAAADLRAIESSSVAVVGLAYPSASVGHPLDGFGYLVGPGSEGPMLGCLFRSTIFPHTAPEGFVLLSCFLGGARHDLSEIGDSRIIEIAKAQVAASLEVSGEPRRVFFQRWRDAIPQFNLGHAERAARVGAWAKNSGVSVICSGVHGVPLPSCISTGRAEATRLAAALTHEPGRVEEAATCP